jgi:hypothetical protein
MPTGFTSSLTSDIMTSPDSPHHSTQATAEQPHGSLSPKGIEHAGVIDFLGFDQTSSEVLLTMVESRPWTPDSPQLFQLQEKLNAYLSFVLDGEMLEAYPQFAQKPVRLRLECATPPGEAEIAFLQHVYEQTLLQGIAFEVEVVGGGGVCGCGQPTSQCSQ